jgi:hypothetical protein
MDFQISELVEALIFIQKEESSFYLCTVSKTSGKLVSTFPRNFFRVRIT